MSTEVQEDVCLVHRGHRSADQQQNNDGSEPGSDGRHRPDIFFNDFISFVCRVHVLFVSGFLPTNPEWCLRGNSRAMKKFANM